MKTPSNIVVAIDRSSHALRVTKHAIDLAKATNSRLNFLFVKIPYGESFDKQIETHRRLFINEQLELLDANHLEVTHDVMEADVVAPTIVDFADEKEADLIIMGSHGRRGFRKFIMGSVALEVVRSANCPVYTIGGKNETEAGKNPLSQLLVPFDFSEYSGDALDYALEMADVLNASIEVLHVVEDSFYPAFYGPFMQSVSDSAPNIEHIARETLQRRIEQTGFDMRRIDITVIPGHPGSDIARYAEDNAKDLIIMATHGLSGVRHLFMGSVAERTAQMATCPVLTLRIKDVTIPSEEAQMIDAN